MNDVLLLVMTNGRRDCIRQTIPSALAMLNPGFIHKVICDDSGDVEYQEWLEINFPTFEIWTTNGKEGFGGAIRSIWSSLRLRTGFNFIFHLEDDFLFKEPIELGDMIAVMNHNPQLQQLALLRQPWNEEEKTAGGIMQLHPEDFFEWQYGPFHWVSQRRFFTTNPCIYRKDLLNLREWPKGENSEGRFTLRLLETYPESVFGFWGKKFAAPKVEHIGHERIGTGY